MEDSLKDKYKKRIQEELEGKYESYSSSTEYKDFVNEFRGRKKNFYEKACAWCDKYIGIEPDKAKAASIVEACNFANLNLTPKGVYSFGILFPVLLVVVFGFPSLLLGDSGFFLFFLVFIGAVSAAPSLLKMPFFLSDNFRLKASNQMVLSVFYLVTYMRHTSNLERAIQFAGDFLNEPLSFEFRKVLWDVEAGKFENVSESLENFLEKWRENNPEFVDAVHLIEGSLLEGSEQRRLEMLDKSLDVILDETYEKMLHFAHNLQSPITTLHMLGIILPILGLVILPLMLSFMEEVKWFHISVVYNIFLPILVFIMGLKILSKRPAGCGSTPINLNNPEVRAAAEAKVKILGVNTGLTPKVFAIIFILFFFVLGLSPLIMRGVGAPDFGWGDDNEMNGCGRQYCFLGYREQEASVTSSYKEIGPFGIGATLTSLFSIIGVGVGIGLFYKHKSEKLKEIFDKSHRLENEFSSALFQLGNRLGDNLPAELATLKVAESLPDTNSGNFFKIVSVNIQKLGMSIDEAIFDSHVGAMIYYPSGLIESSMKVLIQAVKKGPLIASNALINISRYVKEMHKVEERLQDLMAEVISSMKSQISFLTPIIAAIVVGITSMISTIIGSLSQSLGRLGNNLGDSASQMQMVTEFFKASMPTYYFQFIVGLYVVQITLILTIMINAIQNGPDKVNRDYMLGKNLVKSTILYVIVTFIITLVFNLVTGKIMPQI